MEKNYNQIDSHCLFIGAKGENKELLKELIEITVNSTIESRVKYNNNEGSVFENGYFETDRYKESKNKIIENTKVLCEYLKDSIQYSSLRYNGHMIEDPLIIGYAGILSGLFHNQNQCVPQVSYRTSFIEYAVCIDICRMVGFDTSQLPNYYDSIKLDSQIDIAKKENEIIYPFGHITSGGSVSNLEALWSSFWVKLISISTKNAILNQTELENAEDLQIELADGTMKRILDCSTWELLNINSDVSTKLHYQLSLLCNLPTNTCLKLIKQHHVFTMGILDFFNTNQIKPPVFIVPSTAHYSFNKAISLLGLGSKNIISITLESNGRMDINDLKSKLNYCIKNEIPVVNVVGVLGSTQEFVCDDIDSIVSIRNGLRDIHCFNYDIHIDGAFGGYLLSLVRDDYPIENPLDDKLLFPKTITPILNENNNCPIDSFNPELVLGDHLKKQLNACKHVDTITLDPHKTGYLPYSNSIICFKNSKYKDYLSNYGVYLSVGNKSIPVMGVYGVEGSRGGHAATSSYLTQSILRPTKFGYGLLLKRCLLSSKLFFARLILLPSSLKFKAVTIGIQPSLETIKYLKDNLLDKQGNIIDIKTITSNQTLLQTLGNIGSDLNGICFCFNFKTSNTTTILTRSPDISNCEYLTSLDQAETNDGYNTDYNKFIQFNKLIIDRFEVLKGPDTDLILSNTNLTDKYGYKFIDSIFNSSGIKHNIPPNEISFPFIRSTIMSPFISETVDGSYLNTIFNILTKEITIISNEFTAAIRQE